MEMNRLSNIVNKGNEVRRRETVGVSSSKGFFFTMDSMLALLIIVAAIPMLAMLSLSTVSTEMLHERLHLQAEDAINLVSELRVVDVIREPVIANYYNKGIIDSDDVNKSLVDIIGMLWASDNASHTEAARNITESIFVKLMPRNTKWGLRIENDIIYNTSGDVIRTSTISKKIVSGYMKEQPTTGYIAKVFLNRITGKRTASYSFFGGFVGEGTITRIVRDVPENSTVKYIYMELNSGDNFTLYINGNPCVNFTASLGRFAVTNITITNPACLGYINPGEDNTLTLDFYSEELSKNYIGGGYIKIAYDTTEMIAASNEKIRHYLAGIDGLINLYSSFYVPGNITSMNASFHFFNNISKTYMNIGNTTIFNVSSSLTNQTINISNATFASLLNFSQLSKNTVPFIMKTNITNLTARDIDILLVNDRSGSMVQSGWLLNTTASPILEFYNITVPERNRDIGYGDGWSQILEFNISDPSIIEIEAEDYDQYIERDDEWIFQTSRSGYTGTGYLRALEDNGDNFNVPADYTTRSPELRYNVNFPSSGTYYVWVRGYAGDGGDDSIHAGLDNNPVSTADRIDIVTDRWDWSRDTMDGPVATIDVPTAGAHTFNLWMREDGFRIDKIILTNDSSYDPTDTTSGVLDGRLAVGITWDMIPGVIGSEGSEFVVNIRRPDGTWVFDGGTSLPGDPDAGGYVDPPDDDAGNANDYFSGICTKPQWLYVEDPKIGTWYISVFGWNLRPKASPPDEMNVSIMVHVDKGNETGDDINRTETIIAWDSARDNAKLFVNLTEDEDKVGFVRFGSYAELTQALTFDKDDVRTAIDNMGVQGGTAIHEGIDEACNELVNNGRSKDNTTWIMVLLTDGQNDAGPTPVTDAATDCKNNGVIIFTIGLSEFVNHDMLTDVASKPDYYYYAPTPLELENIYRQIAAEIQANYRAQAINITGNISYSILHPDSYIEIGYIEETEVSEYQEVAVNIDTLPLGGCNGSFFIPEQLSKIENVLVTSFSGDFWTHNVSVRSSKTSNIWSSVYELTDYGIEYTELGDPYLVYIPEDLIASNETNNVSVLLAIGPLNVSSNCSASNRIIYTAKFRASTFYSDLFPNAIGSNVTVYFDKNYDGQWDGFVGVEVGKDLDEFNSTLKTVGELDIDSNAVDDAFLRLLDYLNFVIEGSSERSGTADNPIDIELSEDMTIETMFIGGIPYMWGPVDVGIEVWV